MKQPETLTQLLEDMRGESIDSQVETTDESKAVIYLDEDANIDEDGITLSREECRHVFASEGAIERLFEAINDPPEATLALFDVIVPGQILDILERRFIAVDEG